MRHLINREEYIKEYLRINSNNENELYEGLLSTVFGGLKMLFKKDWENINCKNPSILEQLKEIDKSLSGYTMVKMEFSNECNNIRQNIADYYNDILEYKLLQLEKEENAEKFLCRCKKKSPNIQQNTEKRTFDLCECPFYIILYSNHIIPQWGSMPIMGASYTVVNENRKDVV